MEKREFTLDFSGLTPVERDFLAALVTDKTVVEFVHVGYGTVLFCWNAGTKNAPHVSTAVEIRVDTPTVAPGSWSMTGVRSALKAGRKRVVEFELGKRHKVPGWADAAFREAFYGEKRDAELVLHVPTSGGGFARALGTAARSAAARSKVPPNFVSDRPDLLHTLTADARREMPNRSALSILEYAQPAFEKVVVTAGDQGRDGCPTVDISGVSTSRIAHTRVNGVMDTSVCDALFMDRRHAAALSKCRGVGDAIDMSISRSSMWLYVSCLPHVALFSHSKSYAVPPVERFVDEFRSQSRLPKAFCEVHAPTLLKALREIKTDIGNRYPVTIGFNLASGVLELCANGGYSRVLGVPITHDNDGIPARSVAVNYRDLVAAVKAAVASSVDGYVRFYPCLIAYEPMLLSAGNLSDGIERQCAVLVPLSYQQSEGGVVPSYFAKVVKIVSEPGRRRAVSVN